MLFSELPKPSPGEYTLLTVCQALPDAPKDKIEGDRLWDMVGSWDRTFVKKIQGWKGANDRPSGFVRGFGGMMCEGCTITPEGKEQFMANIDSDFRAVHVQMGGQLDESKAPEKKEVTAAKKEGAADAGDKPADPADVKMEEKVPPVDAPVDAEGRHEMEEAAAEEGAAAAEEGAAAAEEGAAAAEEGAAAAEEAAAEAAPADAPAEGEAPAEEKAITKSDEAKPVVDESIQPDGGNNPTDGPIGERLASRHVKMRHHFDLARDLSTTPAMYKWVHGATFKDQQSWEDWMNAQETYAALTEGKDMKNTRKFLLFKAAGAPSADEQPKSMAKKKPGLCICCEGVLT